MSRPAPLAVALAEDRLPSRIWDRETALFAPAKASRGVHNDILNRLGWLQLPSQEGPALAELLIFADEIRQAGVTDVYLLGMGGSSLGAEVLRDIPFGKLGDRSRLTVLDTTDERAIHDVTETLRPERALFLVASKSGGTIEVTALERYFWELMSAARGANVGEHFVAITDPGTALETHATTRHYRRTFLNPPSVGGRYSVLSNFGLVPAALLGVDLGAMMKRARRMADDCRANVAANPGLALGAFMGGQSKQGQDKLTLLLPANLGALGPWIEQLVAESTGKSGVGVLPVVDELVQDIDQLGSDRAFVAVLTPQSVDLAATALTLERAGRPVFRIQTTADQLGAEFFRWEFATAVAGAVLGINPFDEPDVRGAKEQTKKQLEEFARLNRLEPDPPLGRAGSCLRRESRPPEPLTPAGRYVAILDYRPMDLVRRPMIPLLRRDISRLASVATTHGIGPRYLHSTGQFHKGGPNKGLFLMLTSRDATETPVPGANYSFSVLKRAQAFGDFKALAEAGRHVVHFHFDDPDADVSEPLLKAVSELGPRRGPRPDPIR